MDANIVQESFKLEHHEHRRQEFTPQTQLGEGGYATVYKVSKNIDNTLYAMKRSKEKLENNDDEQGYFTDEAKIMYGINDEHVIRLESAWRNSVWRVYFLMELCESYTLKDIINNMAIFTDRELDDSAGFRYIQYFISSNIFADVIKCVHYLHTCYNPVIHRDMRPDNVMVKQCIEEILFKIGDFGLAEYLLGPRRDLDRGERSFMAPELYRGEKYNEKVDVFSLGAIGEMMFGEAVDEQSDKNGFNADDRLRDHHAHLRQLIKRMVIYPERGDVIRPSCEEIINGMNGWLISYDTMRQQVANFDELHERIGTWQFDFYYEFLDRFRLQ